MLASGRLFSSLGHKIWQHYLMPSRLPELRDWYERSLSVGYKFYSIQDYWRLTENGRKAPPPKTILLRHDVDVDISAAREMFSLEKRLGIFGSYYFRLTTMDPSLMKAIAEAGGEASYHYEELAVEAKLNHLRSPVEVRNRLPGIGRMFQKNLQNLRNLTGLPMVSVAAHGDWINRALSLPNTETLKLPALREETGLLVEAYDQELLRFVTARYADAPNPTWWLGGRLGETPFTETTVEERLPRTPNDAVLEGLPILYVLLHPEQWMRGPVCHFKEQLNRLSEAIAYRCRVPSSFAHRTYYKRFKAV